MQVALFTSSSGGPFGGYKLKQLNDNNTVIVSVCVLVALFMTYRFYLSYFKTKEIKELDFDIFSSSSNTEDGFDLNNPMHEEK